MEDLRKKIAALSESTANEYGVELVDIEMGGSLRKPTVRIFIDKEGGVTLEDCSKFSRAMSAVLDVEDPIRTSYTLEVSSPGMDRPLRSLKDYVKNEGKLARVITKEKVGGQNFLLGRISGVQGNAIRLLIDDKGEVEIPFEQISKARLEIEF